MIAEKIHLGCGERYREGWCNIDFPTPEYFDHKIKLDLTHDLTKPLPFDSNSAQFIYNEHVIEHFDLPTGLRIFKECFRILKPGGVLRASTPDLEIIFGYYSNPFREWREDLYIKESHGNSMQTRCEMVNFRFRECGHKYIYDTEEITRRLNEAGFLRIKRVDHAKSDYAELRNIESRLEKCMIIEAVK